MNSTALLARIKRLEQRTGSSGERRAHTFAQLVLAAQWSREANHPGARMGPPELVLEPGEKSPARLILESARNTQPPSRAEGSEHE